MKRRNFLKAAGIGAASIPLMGMPALASINREPLPSEQRRRLGTGYIHSQDCQQFVRKPEEFKKGDIVVDLRMENIEINTPCTGQALYSYLKEQWKGEMDPFPIVAITPQSFVVTGNWAIAGLQHLRNCGLEIERTGKVYAGVCALGQTIDTTHMTFGRFRFPYPGPINSLIPVPDHMKDSPEKFVFTAGDYVTNFAEYGIGTVGSHCYYIPVCELIKLEDYYG